MIIVEILIVVFDQRKKKQKKEKTIERRLHTAGSSPSHLKRGPRKIPVRCRKSPDHWSQLHTRNFYITRLWNQRHFFSAFLENEMIRCCEHSMRNLKALQNYSKHPTTGKIIFIEYYFNIYFILYMKSIKCGSPTSQN